MEPSVWLAWGLVAMLLIILILLVKKNKQIAEAQIEAKAGQLLESWKRKEEKRIRQSAIEGSQAVTLGKSIEHLIPYFGEFPYNPKDVRFMGSPVDLVVFDGLSEGNLKQVIFIEVKTGKKPTLPPREKMVKACIEAKNVYWQLLHYQTE